MDMDDWDNGLPCNKDGLPFCAECKPNKFAEIVYVTSNGSAFHQTKDCKWLLIGVTKVKKQWKLDDVQITPMKSQTALGRGYNPCTFCASQAERGRV